MRAEVMPPIKGFMFDLDGTLLLSDRSLGGYEVLPGAVEVLAELAAKSIPFVVLTNGSAYPPPEQAKRLRGLDQFTFFATAISFEQKANSVIIPALPWINF